MRSPNKLETQTSATAKLAPLLILALIARVIAAAMVFHFRWAPPLRSWGFENVALALSLHQGHGYGSPFFTPSGPSAFMAPGYPMLVAGFMALFGIGQLASNALIALQIVISVATLPVVILLARRHFGQYTANLAGVIYAIAPPALFWTTYIWDTCLAALLLVSAVLLFPRLPNHKWILFLSGACCAVAALINPGLLPTLLVLLARRFWKLQVRPWAALAGFFIIFSAWPVRNALVMHAFVPLRSSVPWEFWLGNHPGGDGNYSDAVSTMMNANERAVFLKQGEMGYMRAKSQLATQYIQQHPGKFVLLSFKRIGRFWAGTSNVHGPATWYLTVLALAGLIAGLRAKRMTSSMLMPLLIYPLPYYVTHADVRYESVLNPILIVLAAEAMAWLLGAPESTTEDLGLAATSTAGNHPAPGLSLQSPLKEDVP